MTEEEKPKEEPKSKKEEAVLGVLQQAREEREKLEKVRDDLKKDIEHLEQLKAFDIMSGRAEHPIEQPKKEITPKEYAEQILKGIL